MRIQPRGPVRPPPPPIVEAEPTDPPHDTDAIQAAFRWLDAARPETVEHPILRPIVGRDLHRRVFQDVLQKRAVPLLRRLLVAQGELRGESAARARDRTKMLLERIRTFDRSLLDSPDRFFEEVSSLSRDLDAIIDDANYAVFGTIGLLHQLRTLNLALRSSEKLWHSVRMAHAMRRPDLQAEALRIGIDAQQTFDRGWRGDDIGDDLAALEERFGDFKQHLDTEMKRDSGLAPGLDGLRVSRRVWSYRGKLEKAILAREGRTGEHLDNQELCAWVRKNGIPPEVVQEILQEDVLPVLRAMAEEPERANAAGDLRRRTEELIARIENLDPKQLRTADQVEALFVEIGRSLDAILADAERVAKPADRLVRRLRESRAAADAIRLLLLGMRINETAQDASYLSRATGLLREVESIGEGDARDLEWRLAELERDLIDFGNDTKARLKVDHLPLLDRGLGLIRGARRGLRLRSAAELALNPEVQRAVEAFNDLEMPAEKRREIYDRALGQPLLETVVGLLLALREVDLGFSFADVGRGLERFLRAGGGDHKVNPLIAKSPLAFLARAEFERAFSRFDDFLQNAHTPQRKRSIDASLNVVRAVATVEREALGHVAARIPEGEGIMVAAASVEWMIASAQVLLEWAAKELAAPSGLATADFLDLMVDATESHLDALIGKDPKLVDEDDLLQLRRGMHLSAAKGARQIGVHRAPDAVKALGANPIDESYAERLNQINQRLLQRLERVETTEESRKAMQHILADLGATLRTVVNLVHLFGAATNDLMDPDERSNAIQGSVERMGPLFVKLMQTLANMQTLIAKVSPDLEIAEDDPLFSSLKKLQDEVTPLPWKYIEGQIRTSFGLSKEAPLTEAEGEQAPFVSIEREPLKSGSIGQTHRAKIRVDRGHGEEIVDTVVKVLRPDIDKTFEDTIRVTRLTMLVFQELLRLDVNGSIFGEVKDQAERVLAMLERALEGFIESFRVETNFAQEAANMRAFRAMLAPDRSIIVPEVFDSHTKGNILTMEEIKGFKLSKWLERHRFAEASPKLAEEMGPLPKIGATEEAIARARSFVEQTYDGNPVEARVDRKGFGSTHVRVRFTDFAGRLLDRTIEVKNDGKIRLPDGPLITRRGAEKKATIWGQCKFGLPVKSVSAQHVEEPGWFFGKREGYRVELSFDSRLEEKATVFVDRKTGELEPRSEVPDLTSRGLEGLRDRLGTTFGVQIARGLLHGDPHEGNFFVMPDGKRIGLIDFGLAIEMGLFDASGPLKLFSSAFLRNPKGMAEAMLAMSTQADLPEGPERDAILSNLTKHYARILREVERDARKKNDALAGRSLLLRMKHRVLDRFEQTLEASKRSLEYVLRSAALAPSPRHLQALKATFSMGGNLAQIEREGLDTPKWKRALRLFKNITLQLALRPFAGRKERAERKVVADRVAALNAAIPRLQLHMLEHVKESGAPD